MTLSNEHTWKYLQQFRNNSLKEASNALSAERLKFENELNSARSLCSHELGIEVEYAPSKYGNSLPPRRLCLFCGLEEDGWGCGYEVLNKTAILAEFKDRSAFYKYRYT